MHLVIDNLIRSVWLTVGSWSFYEGASAQTHPWSRFQGVIHNSHPSKCDSFEGLAETQMQLHGKKTWTDCNFHGWVQYQIFPKSKFPFSIVANYFSLFFFSKTWSNTCKIVKADNLKISLYSYRPLDYQRFTGLFRGAKWCPCLCCQTYCWSKISHHHCSVQL